MVLQAVRPIGKNLLISTTSNFVSIIELPAEEMSWAVDGPFSEPPRGQCMRVFGIVILSTSIGFAACGKKSSDGTTSGNDDNDKDDVIDDTFQTGALNLGVPAIQPPMVEAAPAAMGASLSLRGAQLLANMSTDKCWERADKTTALECAKDVFFKEGPNDFIWLLGAIDGRLTNIDSMLADKTVDCLTATPAEWTVQVPNAAVSAPESRKLYLQCRIEVPKESDDVLESEGTILFGKKDDSYYIVEAWKSKRKTGEGSDEITFPQHSFVFAKTDKDAKNVEIWQMVDDDFYFERPNTLHSDSCASASSDCSRSPRVLQVVADRSDPEVPVMHLAAAFAAHASTGACGVRFTSKGDVVKAQNYEDFDNMGTCLVTPEEVCASAADFSPLSGGTECADITYGAASLTSSYLRADSHFPGGGTGDVADGLGQYIVDLTTLEGRDEVPLFFPED